jgi:hypothetical protein
MAGFSTNHITYTKEDHYLPGYFVAGTNFPANAIEPVHQQIAIRFSSLQNKRNLLNDPVKKARIANTVISYASRHGFSKIVKKWTVARIKTRLQLESGSQSIGLILSA